MKVSHRTLIFCAGFVWFASGSFLLSFGINLILGSLQKSPEIHFSLLQFFQRFFTKDPTQAALLLVTFGLFVGYLKARCIFTKAVKKQVVRILGFTNPTSIKNLYSRGYYILIASMVGMGFLMRALPISSDTRGTIDVIIGSALLQGALFYFRYATTSYTEIKKKSLL